MTGYNRHSPEIHMAIFQLKVPKPQGKGDLSLDVQYPLHRVPTCKALDVPDPRTVQERILCPRT